MVELRTGSSLEGKRVAVIGASGFIGSRVVSKLVRAQGAAVTAIVRSASKARDFEGQGIEVRRADLGDSRDLAQALEGQSLVINTAHDFQASREENRRGFVNLLDGCVAAGVERLVHTSSIVVYDDWPSGTIDESSPRSESGFEYKTAKVAMEAMLQQRAAQGALDSIALQPTIVYGPGGWIWTDSILERLETGTVVLPEACDGACHAVYVDDVADALILATACDTDASVPEARRFIISGPAPTSWRAFFTAYDRIVGRDSLRFEALEPPPQTRSDGADEDDATGTTSGSLPARMTSSEAVRGALRRLRKTIGEPRVDRVRRGLLGLRQRLGPIEYWPRPDEVALYRATGRCSIELAHQTLGYAPRVSFEEGIEQIASQRQGRVGGLGTAGDAEA